MRTLHEFLNAEIITPAPDQFVPVNELQTQFYKWLARQGEDIGQWPISKIKKELRAEGFILGSTHEGLAVANCYDPQTSKKKWILEGKHLRLKPIAS